MVRHPGGYRSKPGTAARPPHRNDWPILSKKPPQCWACIISAFIRLIQRGKLKPCRALPRQAARAPHRTGQTVEKPNEADYEPQHIQRPPTIRHRGTSPPQFSGARGATAETIRQSSDLIPNFALRGRCLFDAAVRGGSRNIPTQSLNDIWEWRHWHLSFIGFPIRTIPNREFFARCRSRMLPSARLAGSHWENRVLLRTFKCCAMAVERATPSK